MNSTPQTRIVQQKLQQMKHATNQQLHLAVLSEMPHLSLTSVHRITKRLIENNMASSFMSNDGNVVIDARVDAHNHFNCLVCGGVIDIDLDESVKSSIQNQIDSNIIGALTINGTCGLCSASK